MLFLTVKPASAEKDWTAGCHDRLEESRDRIDRDIQRHGENSRQVSHDRDKLEDARRWCRDHHADWDHDRFDSGVYIHPQPTAEANNSNVKQAPQVGPVVVFKMNDHGDCYLLSEKAILSNAKSDKKGKWITFVSNLIQGNATDL
jgi:hypothetical protein